MAKPGSFLRRSLLAAGFAAIVSASPAALGAPRVYISLPPPPLVVETRPVAPGPHHVWVEGYHRWDGHAYVWVPGAYAIPPHHYTVWVPGHYAHHHTHGYYWVAGHWRH